MYNESISQLQNNLSKPIYRLDKNHLQKVDAVGTRPACIPETILSGRLHSSESSLFGLALRLIQLNAKHRKTIHEMYNIVNSRLLFDE